MTKTVKFYIISIPKLDNSMESRTILAHTSIQMISNLNEGCFDCKMCQSLHSFNLLSKIAVGVIKQVSQQNISLYVSLNKY